MTRPRSQTSFKASVEQVPSIDGRRPLSLKAGALALTLSTMWAGNPVANKAGLEDAGPLRLGYLRFILGAIVVLISVSYTHLTLPTIYSV